MFCMMMISSPKKPLEAPAKANPFTRIFNFPIQRGQTTKIQSQGGKLVQFGFSKINNEKISPNIPGKFENYVKWIFQLKIWIFFEDWKFEGFPQVLSSSGSTHLLPISSIIKESAMLCYVCGQTMCQNSLPVVVDEKGLGKLAKKTQGTREKSLENFLGKNIFLTIFWNLDFPWNFKKKCFRKFS